MALRDNKEKEKTSREATGKYFYTLSQTCFAAMVIVAIILPPNWTPAFC